MKRPIALLLASGLAAVLAGGGAGAGPLTRVTGVGVTGATIDGRPGIVSLSVDATGHCCVLGSPTGGAGTAEIAVGGEEGIVTVAFWRATLWFDELRAEGLGDDGACWSIAIRDVQAPMSDHANVVRAQPSGALGACSPQDPTHPVFGDFVFSDAV